jgi:urea transport system ATP-binding protein
MLTVTNLNQYYGGSHILRNVSFDVPMGKVTTLLGRNGVGKTTLLKTLMGLVPAATGSISWGRTSPGRPASACAPASATCPRARDLPAPHRGGEPADGPRHPAGSSEVPTRIFEMFPVLKQMMRRRGGDLSGGQQQQLAIGRALAPGPKLLILDEPTEGIQPSIIKDIERAIRALAETGEMAILLVEQYYDFARSLADHYLLMERGEIISRGAGMTWRPIGCGRCCRCEG